MNAFVCSVILSSEVSSRNCFVPRDRRRICLIRDVVLCLEVSMSDYIVTTDECIRLQCDKIQLKWLVFEIGLETTQKMNRKWGKIFEKSSFQVKDGLVKRTETRQGWENSITLPTTNNKQPPFCPPMQSTCILIVCLHWVDQWKNGNNLAILHAIDTRLALMDYACKCTCYT